MQPASPWAVVVPSLLGAEVADGLAGADSLELLQHHDVGSDKLVGIGARCRRSVGCVRRMRFSSCGTSKFVTPFSHLTKLKNESRRTTPTLELDGSTKELRYVTH
jgi:hypothetical protein